MRNIDLNFDNTFIQLKMYHYYKKKVKYIYIERAFTKLEKQI